MKLNQSEISKMVSKQSRIFLHQLVFRAVCTQKPQLYNDSILLRSEHVFTCILSRSWKCCAEGPSTVHATVCKGSRDGFMRDQVSNLCKVIEKTQKNIYMYICFKFLFKIDCPKELSNNCHMGIQSYKQMGKEYCRAFCWLQIL